MKSSSAMIYIILLLWFSAAWRILDIFQRQVYITHHPPGGIFDYTKAIPAMNTKTLYTYTSQSITHTIFVI